MALHNCLIPGSYTKEVSDIVHNTYTRGQWAENIAFDYLTKQGLKPLERNFQGPGGEIDIIMEDKKVIAFVEVRYRANDHFVSALESIDQ